MWDRKVETKNNWWEGAVYRWKSCEKNIELRQTSLKQSSGKDACTYRAGAKSLPTSESTKMLAKAPAPCNEFTYREPEV